MKKIIALEKLNPLFAGENTFFSRADIEVLFVPTNDEALALHIEQRADLIVTTFGLPGLSCESLFTMIRQSQGLRSVSTIIIAENTPGLHERSVRCGPDAVLTQPVDAGLFLSKVQDLLVTAPRRSYRAMLNVAVEGTKKDRSFLCNLENISVAGALIKTEETLAPGDGLFCSFYLPDGTHVRVHGEIVRAVQEGWSKTFQYGVKFADIRPDARTAIEAFVNREIQKHHAGASSGHAEYTRPAL
jgi:CheY-like chemotaxis protein